MIESYQQFNSLKALFELQNLQKCLIFKISTILHEFNKNNLLLKKYKQFLLVFMLFFTLIASLIKWKIYWKVLAENLSLKYLIKDFIFVMMLKVLILFRLHHDTIFNFISWITLYFQLSLCHWTCCLNLSYFQFQKWIAFFQIFLISFFFWKYMIVKKIVQHSSWNFIKVAWTFFKKVDNLSYMISLKALKSVLFFDHLSIEFFVIIVSCSSISSNFKSWWSLIISDVLHNSCMIWD